MCALRQYIRIKIIRTLAKRRNVKAINALIVTLGHYNSNVRNEARDALAKIGQLAIDGLVAALRHLNPDLRSNARGALDKIDSTWPKSEAAKKQIPDFIAALRDSNSDVQREAAKVLMETGDARAVDGLIAALKGDSDVRAEAAKALGEIGDARAVDGLIAALRYGDSNTRNNAKDALDKIDANWPKSEVAKKHVPDFIAVLKYGDSNFRSNTRDALEKIDVNWPKSEAAKKQIPEFIAALRHGDFYEQKDARDTLEKIDANWPKSEAAKKQIPEFIAALRDWNSDVQKDARDALVKIGQPAIDGLIAELRDKKDIFYGSRGQAEAAKVLGEIGDARAVDGLIAALKEKDVRVNADNALKMINKRQSPLLNSYPYLFCRACHLRPKKKRVKVGFLGDFNYTICRGCNSSLHLIKDVKEVIGFIGGEGEDYRIDGERIYIKLWSEAEKKGRNADIDILEIRNSPLVNYDYAINAVLNTLVNDISRSRDFVKNIPVVLKGNIPISGHSRHLLNHEFGGIRDG